MKSTSLKAKMILQLLALAVFFLVFLGFSISSMRQLQGQLELFSKQRLPISVEILNLDSNLNAVYRFSWLALARSEDPKGRQEAMSLMESYLTKIDQSFTQLDTLPLLEANKILLTSVKVNFLEIVTQAKLFSNALSSSEPDKDLKAKTIMLTSGKKFGVPATKILLEMLKNVNLANESATIESQKTTERVISVIIFGGIAFIGLYLGLSFFFIKKISDKLSAISESVRSSSQNVSTGSSQLSATSSQFSSSSTETSASLTESVASVEELTSLVKINTEHTTKAEEVSESTARIAAQGTDEAEKLRASIMLLSESSKKIEDIVALIDDIAFQTNLLALNAAVEAARAGEQGKGFAVVADAVRGLAQKSSSSAEEISEHIQQNVSRTSVGLKSAEVTLDILTNVSKSVNSVLEVNKQIAASSKEQFLAFNQISLSLNQLDQASQANAAAAEQVAATSQELNSQAVLLSRVVGELDVMVSGQIKS